MAFSLGAAIGATGKFPQLKTTVEKPDAQADRNAAFLQRQMERVAVPQDDYHNAYIEDVKLANATYIAELSKMDRDKDPAIVEKASTQLNNLMLGNQRLRNKSLALKGLEKFSEEGKAQGKYVSPSVEKAATLTRRARSEAELKKLLLDNPDIFADGYITFSPETGQLTANREQDIVDFDKIMSKVFDNKTDMILFDEKVSNPKNPKLFETRQYYSIPKDEAEAKEIQRVTPANVKDVSKNAFQLGRDRWNSNPQWHEQYRSVLYHDGRPDAIEPSQMNNDQLYQQFYEDYVVRNIPAFALDKTSYVGARNIVNINNSIGGNEAPTSFVVGREMYSGSIKSADGKTMDITIASDYSTIASKDPDGVLIQIPTTASVIDMRTMDSGNFSGKSLKDFRVSRVALFPAKRVKTPSGAIILIPISEEEENDRKKENRPVLKAPFAMGNYQRLVVNTVPDIGSEAYAIPLYALNKDNEFIVPQAQRNSKQTQGSVILSGITTRQKWDQPTKENWDAAYMTIMKQIVDDADLKQKK